MLGISLYALDVSGSEGSHKGGARKASPCTRRSRAAKLQRQAEGKQHQAPRGKRYPQRISLTLAFVINQNNGFILRKAYNHNNKPILRKAYINNNGPILRKTINNGPILRKAINNGPIRLGLIPNKGYANNGPVR
eukprot:1180997-Prorocentrum_minimum.AAC.2